MLALPGCGSAPYLTASPNPVPRGAEIGTTTIAWSTGDDRIGRVYVTKDGSAEALFAEGARGESSAPWIQAGARYEFRLYAGLERTLLATRVVTRRTDTHVALNIALAAAAVLIAAFVAGGSARRWAVEIGPVAIVVLGLWVKFVALGTSVTGFEVPSDRLALSAPLAVLMVPFSPLMFLGWSLRSRIALAVGFAGAMLALTDLLHLRFYEDVASISELAHAHQLVLVWPEIVSLLRGQDTLFFLDLAILLALLPVLRARHRAPANAWLIAPIACVAGLALTWPAVRYVTEDPRGIFYYNTSRRLIVSRIGVLPYHLFDAFTHARYAWTGRLAVTDVDRHRSLQFLNNLRWSRAAPGELTGAARGRNVILVMAESLQAFPLTLAIEGRPVMPRLAAFARESVWFDSLLDQTADGTTSDAEFTSLQSLHPLSDGVVATRYSANAFRALPAVLRDHGYRTLSMTADAGHVWNKVQMHPRLGFSQSFFREHFDASESYGLGLADGSFFRQALDRLKTVPSPFMAFLVTVSSHTPYTDAPERYRSFDVGDLERTRSGAYLEAMHALDEAFGAFVDGLRAAGLLDQTVVVVYGDHQASVRDAAHPSSFTRGSPASRYDRWKTEQSLPLVIRLPGGAHARRISIPAGQLDVAPTVIGLLGLEDGLVMMGRDLTRAVTRPVIFRQGSLAAATHTFLSGHEDAGSPGCYENVTGAEVACEMFAGARAGALEEFQHSDRIVTGNLISELTDALARLDVAGDSQSQPPLGSVQIIAHRGNSSVAPENTVEAIERGFDAGAAMIEVDLRLSRDGVPILLHDDTLDRTTSGTGPAVLLPLAELRALDAGSWMNPAFAGARVPTLADAMRIARRREGSLLLDLKVDGLGRAIADTMRRESFPAERLAIGTWTRDQAADMARHVPDALILASDGWTGAPVSWSDEYFAEARGRGIDGFELGTNWSPRFIAAAHAHGMPVYAFTINDDNLMRRLLRAGIDGIETDRPARLVAIVAERATTRGRRTGAAPGGDRVDQKD